MSGRRRESMFVNPVLIGALTVLVTIVAVTLAYNANNGLPFVPSYSLHVQIANASELTHGAEVHMRGGELVGSVSSLTATRNSAGQPIAVLNLKLQRSIEPLPADSRFTVRLKGAIGLKYLEITPGVSKRTFPNGTTVPTSQTSAEIDLDQVLSMFTPPTRAGVRASTIGFGTALAGRGRNLNDAIGAFVPLLGDLVPVARNLASPRTDFGGFFRGLERFSRALVPVAQTQADLYTNLDTTFRALAGVAVPYIQDWISQTPPTFSATIADSPKIRPFLTDTATLFSELRPGFATLPQSAPQLADAFAVGARNLPGTAALDRRTTSLSERVGSYSQDPAVQKGIDRLTLTASRLEPPLAFLTPVQASCNYVTLFLRNTASLLSENVATGSAFRFLSVAISQQPLGAESVPSQRPYGARGQRDLNGQYVGPVHANPYPNTDSPGQPAECAAGNEVSPKMRYSGAHAVIGNPPGNLGLNTERTSRGAR